MLMKPLEPPDSHHLSAAIGWLGLGNWREANEELEKITSELRGHPDVLEVRPEFGGGPTRGPFLFETHKTMKTKKLVMVAMLALAAIAPAATAQTSQTGQIEIKQQHDARVEWWREAKFGMFIHWGVYSVPAGEWNGKTNYAEWIMEEAHIPASRYELLAKE